MGETPSVLGEFLYSYENEVGKVVILHQQNFSESQLTVQRYVFDKLADTHSYRFLAKVKRKHGALPVVISEDDKIGARNYERFTLASRCFAASCLAKAEKESFDNALLVYLRDNGYINEFSTKSEWEVDKDLKEAARTAKKANKAAAKAARLKTPSPAKILPERHVYVNADDITREFNQGFDDSCQRGIHLDYIRFSQDLYSKFNLAAAQLQNPGNVQFQSNYSFTVIESIVKSVKTRIGPKQAKKVKENLELILFRGK